jgi:hypothetical protein
MLDEDGPFVTYADHVEALRQGQRDVFSPHPQWAEGGMCNPGCLPCKRLTELIEEREVGYLEGYGAAMEDGWGEPGHIKAAIASAVQIVEDLPCKCNEGADYCDGQTDAIAAIMTLAKGDQP